MCSRANNNPSAEWEMSDCAMESNLFEQKAWKSIFLQQMQMNHLTGRPGKTKLN